MNSKDRRATLRVRREGQHFDRADGAWLSTGYAEARFPDGNDPVASTQLCGVDIHGVHHTIVPNSTTVRTWTGHHRCYYSSSQVLHYRRCSVAASRGYRGTGAEFREHPVVVLFKEGTHSRWGVLSYSFVLHPSGNTPACPRTRASGLRLVHAVPPGAIESRLLPHCLSCRARGAPSK